LGGIYHTGKFSQKIIADIIHDTPAMRLNPAGQNQAVFLERLNGPGFVISHQAAVAFDIRTEDGTKFSSNTGIGHEMLLFNGVWGKGSITKRKNIQVIKISLYFSKLYNMESSWVKP
jgi:hypothetical protein